MCNQCRWKQRRVQQHHCQFEPLTGLLEAKKAPLEQLTEVKASRFISRYPIVLPGLTCGTPPRCSKAASVSIEEEAEGSQKKYFVTPKKGHKEPKTKTPEVSGTPNPRPRGRKRRKKKPRLCDSPTFFTKPSQSLYWLWFRPTKSHPLKEDVKAHQLIPFFHIFLDASQVLGHRRKYFFFRHYGDLRSPINCKSAV